MSVFNYLKSRLSILDVIGEYTQLKKAGNYWKGHCPFHSEKTASFTVSPLKEIFYCFGCHVGGDVITFIEKVEHITPKEAILHLADRYGIDLPNDASMEISGHDKKHYYDLCKLVAIWCHEHLRRSPAALHYLLKRGFSKEIMKEFIVGYFPGGYMHIKELVGFVQKHHFLAKDLIDAGIIQEGKTVLYSSFEERIIFPIKDHLGRFCGFGGRIFKQQDDRPKYYNSRENHYFNKGALLFGFDRAKKSIQETGSAYLVEGYADCVAMAQYGYTNTVATLGTACTAEHLKQLSRYAQQLFVLYDGDKAGKEAILRLTGLCWQASLELKVICLPSQEDPASFLTTGHTLEPLIAQAQDIFFFYIDSLGSAFGTKPLAEKLDVTRKLLTIIKTVDDIITQDILLQRAAKTVDIPFESLKKELHRLSQSPQQQAVHKKPEITPQKTLEPAPFKLTNDQKLEKNLFFAILNNIELIKNDSVKFLIDYLPKDESRILKKLMHDIDQTPSMDFMQFFDSLDSYDKELASKSLLEYEGGLEPAVFEQLIVQLQKKNWKTIVHSVKQQLDQAQREGNSTKEQQLLQQFLALKKKLLGTNIP